MQANGGLKDIFKTILSDTEPIKPALQPQRIVVHGDGNVIAPGGTVHYVQAPVRRAKAQHLPPAN